MDNGASFAAHAGEDSGKSRFSFIYAVALSYSHWSGNPGHCNISMCKQSRSPPPAIGSITIAACSKHAVARENIPGLYTPWTHMKLTYVYSSGRPSSALHSHFNSATTERTCMPKFHMLRVRYDSRDVHVSCS